MGLGGCEGSLGGHFLSQALGMERISLDEKTRGGPLRGRGTPEWKHGVRSGWGAFRRQ